MSPVENEERPSIAIVVAVADNGVIGRDGDLPWRLPADLKHFKRLTLGHTVIMGRRTYASIGKPLPKRRNLVLSRDPDFAPPGVEIARSLDSAFQLSSGESAFVIGGAGVFAEALPQAQILHWTQVHAEVVGDVFFPEVDWSEWRLVSEEHHEADERHAHAYTFRRYERLSNGEPFSDA